MIYNPCNVTADRTIQPRHESPTLVFLSSSLFTPVHSIQTGWWDVSKCSHSMEKSFHTWKKWLGGTVLLTPFQGNSSKQKFLFVSRSYSPRWTLVVVGFSVLILFMDVVVAIATCSASLNVWLDSIFLLCTQISAIAQSLHSGEAA